MPVVYVHIPSSYLFVFKSRSFNKELTLVIAPAMETANLFKSSGIAKANSVGLGENTT